MKAKPVPKTDEEIRIQNREDDLKVSRELRKTVLKLSRKLASLSTTDMLAKCETKHPNGTVSGHSAALLKDLSTAIEKLQRVSLLGLSDTPAERHARQPAGGLVYDVHRAAIEQEIDDVWARLATPALPAVDVEVLDTQLEPGKLPQTTVTPTIPK